jgi:hypothetical protein
MSRDLPVDVARIMATSDRRGFVPRAIAQFLAQDYQDRQLNRAR